MTLWEVIAFLEVQPIEKSWKELIVSQAGEEGIRRIAAEAGEFEQPGAVAGAIWGFLTIAPKTIIPDLGSLAMREHFC